MDTTRIKPQGREVTIPELATTGVVEYETETWGVTYGVLWIKVNDTCWIQPVEPRRYDHVWK